MEQEIMDLKTLSKYLRRMYEEKIPFNKLLKVKVISLEEGDISIRIDMRDELIGNYTYKMLHGGVISSVLDLTGGIIVSMSVVKNMADKPVEEIAQKMSKLGTIDLRVDYLRPGRGNYFISTGSVMRMGNKVVVTRMSLHNDKKLLIAVGTGTYMLG